MDNDILRDLLVFLPTFIIAISLHEFGHAYMAHYLGDPTPEQAGRLTLNPLAHLDLFGTIMMVFAHFGWAKPVPINPENFNKKVNINVGIALVGIAGPFINLLLAYISYQLLVIFPVAGVDSFLQISLWVNAMLCVFNLIPIPPLDGANIVRVFLPDNIMRKYDEMANYGFIILVILIMLPITGQFLNVAIVWVIKFLSLFVIGG